MLMFTNAIMYNNCNHNVHKMAVEMYDDVMTHIEVRYGHMIILIYSSFYIKLIHQIVISVFKFFSFARPQTLQEPDLNIRHGRVKKMQNVKIYS